MRKIWHRLFGHGGLMAGHVTKGGVHILFCRCGTKLVFPTASALSASSARYRWDAQDNG